mgnify:CR=1 FL=1
MKAKWRYQKRGVTGAAFKKLLALYIAGGRHILHKRKHGYVEYKSFSQIAADFNHIRSASTYRRWIKARHPSLFWNMIRGEEPLETYDGMLGNIKVETLNSPERLIPIAERVMRALQGDRNVDIGLLCAAFGALIITRFAIDFSKRTHDLHRSTVRNELSAAENKEEDQKISDDHNRFQKHILWCICLASLFFVIASGVALTAIRRVSLDKENATASIINFFV